ncbi:MAG: copper homeostasis periplasmic binding protein CopC [Brevundimonas sp.]|jgi:methionine-rich copper-binding protein CopC|uniref:Copper homeostasis periplasmic binding protein CopC n=1 Tax=Brevundimonas olei TaxID=657642 RepID=A0ABZ2IGR8_9CAUL|nr:copper homeostasis periplasmic binding protein CopC [Brevundimonas sp.]MCH4268550.1 copper homeostasis periplasmic binding protein CopC [Brevundimonas sp.]
MSFLRPLAFPSLAAAVALASVVLPPIAAQAHARLVSATPAAKSTVASPRTVTLTFSERVAPAFSSFDVVNAAGTKATIRTEVSQDGKTITGALARPLAAGAYVVNWRIASVDGHRMTGSYDFVVR